MKRYEADIPTRGSDGVQAVPEKRLGRKPKHSQADILRAACMLLAEKGYHNTTMQEIAEAAKLTKGGLYHYLKSKEDVLYLLHDDFIKEGLRRLEPIAQSELPCGEKFARMIAAHLRLLHDYYHEIRLFFREMHILSGERHAVIRAMRERYEEYFVRVIEDCVSAGVLRTSEPRITVLFVLGAVNWMFMWYRPGGRLGPDELATMLVHMVLEGLSAADGAASREREDDRVDVG